MCTTSTLFVHFSVPRRDSPWVTHVGDPRRNVRKETVVPRSDAEGEVWWILLVSGRRGKTKTDSLLPGYMIYIYVYEIKHISLSTTYVKMKENIFSYTILIQILMNQLYT